MIRKGWEIALFIMIFVVCGLLLLPPFLQLKAGLPVNEGMSAEEVIKQEYPQVDKAGCDYVYAEKDNFLFLFVDTADDKGSYTNYTFDVGFKNSKSGYILGLPGVFDGDIHEYKIAVLRLENEEVIGLEIRRYFGSDYVIMIEQRNADGIEFFVDGNEMDSISYKNETKWIDTVNDLSNDFEIYALYKGEKIDIITAQDIERAFKEAGHGLLD